MFSMFCVCIDAGFQCLLRTIAKPKSYCCVVNKNDACLFYWYFKNSVVLALCIRISGYSLDGNPCAQSCRPSCTRHVSYVFILTRYKRRPQYAAVISVSKWMYYDFEDGDMKPVVRDAVFAKTSDIGVPIQPLAFYTLLKQCQHLITSVAYKSIYFYQHVKHPWKWM